MTKSNLTPRQLAYTYAIMATVWAICMAAAWWRW